MRTREPDPGLGAAASEVAAHAKSVARLEAKLAALELKEKVSALGVGIGLGLGAALLGLFGFALFLGTVIAVLAIFLDLWLAFLIVTAACLALALTLGVLAVGALRRGTPPVPREAIQDAKATAEALKNGHSRTAYS